MSDEIDKQETAEEGHPLLWSITALLLLVLIAVAGYKYREHIRSTVIATAPLDSNCMLNIEPCTATLSNGSSATLAIAPHPIVAATPMQLSLQLNGIAAQDVEIHFRGESMNMGLSQFILTHQSGGNFAGEAILPVCVRNSMIWIADVLVATPQGKLAFPFRFETIHP
ncbi:MAG: hypothetical protein ABFS08_00590 [Pseudomonadota bacterium]